MRDELIDAQRKAEESRLHIEEALSRIQSRIDESTAGVRHIAMTPFKAGEDHPFAFATIFFLAGVAIGLLTDETGEPLPPDATVTTV